MATKMPGVIQHLCRLAFRDGAGLTDGELLTAFVRQRDDGALAALVNRHAPMVWGVCRRLLRGYQDAEDAFQATFLVFVHKAAAVRDREAVANWLYGVAHQTAVRVRATVALQRGREQPMIDVPAPATREANPGDDLLALLDQELSRLPDKYRVLIVLCDLEGKTRKEVARKLDCPEGTVAGRLARARTMLANRLRRHSPGGSGGALASALAQKGASASVPTSVLTSTIKAATLTAAGRAVTGLVSARVAALTDGVLKTMLLTKLKSVTMAVLLVLGMAGLGAGLLTHALASAQSGGDGVKKNPDEAKRPAGEGKKGAPAEQAAAEEAPDAIAWGKAVDGLQAGIGLRPGEKASYRVGQSVTLFIHLRNVGTKTIDVSFVETVFEEFLPNVVNKKGKNPRVLQGPMNLGSVPIVKRTLEKDEQIRLGSAYLVIVPPGTKGVATGPTLVAGPGKYDVYLSGFPLRRAGNDFDEQKWATGRIEIQIEEPAVDAKPQPSKVPPPHPNDNVNGPDKADVDPLKVYPQSLGLAANLAWHRKVGLTEIRTSWFAGGNPGVAMVCTANLAAGNVDTWREVYNWAGQGLQNRALGAAEIRGLRKVAAALPPSAKKPDLKNLVLVSVSERGEVKTYLYDRTKLPPEITRLYKLTGAELPPGSPK